MATVNPTSTVLPPGGVAAVDYAAIAAPAVGDWIGLAVQGSTDSQYVEWFYAGSSSKTRPATGSAAGRCTFVIPASCPQGSAYEFRLFSNDSFTKLATSPTVGILTETGATLSAIGSACPGVILPVDFSGVTSPVPGDWLGLYPVGAIDQSTPAAWVYDSSTSNPATNTRGTARSAGTVLFPVPANLPAGSYELRLFRNDAYTRIGTRAITITAPATITPATSSVNPGQLLSLTFAGVAPPSDGDWIALYPEGSPASQGMSAPWVYAASGTKVRGTQVQGGTVQYKIPDSPPVPDGPYEVRLYARDSMWRIAVTPAGSLQVVAIPSTVSASPAGVVPGGKANGTFNIPYTAAISDWMGVFPVGSPASATPVNWVYTNSGTQVKGTGIVKSATRAITIPTGTSLGSYEVRTYHGDIGTGAAVSLIASSSPFGVTAAPPPLLFATTSPWNMKATGYAVDPASNSYIANLASVMDVVKNSGQGAQNLGINGAEPSYTAYGIPPYALPLYFAAAGATTVRVTARREYGSSDPWWGDVLASPNGQGFAAVPLSTSMKADHGYGSCDSGSWPPCTAGYPRYDPEVSPAMPLFPAGGWPQWQTGDHHLIVVSQSLNAVWEFWKLGYNVPDPNDPNHVPIAGWSASGAVKWALNGPGYGPVASGMGSARAYGGAAVAGLITKKEIDAGVIPHALAFAYSYTDGIYYAAGQAVAPAGAAPMCIATHTDGYCVTKAGVPAYTRNNAGRAGGAGPGLSIPEGARLRLKQSVSVAGRAAAWEAAHPGRGRAATILGTAMQQYGLYVVDHSGILYDQRHPTTAVPTANLYAEHQFGLPGQTWSGALRSDDARAFPSSDFEVLLLPTLTRLDPTKYPCT